MNLRESPSNIGDMSVDEIRNELNKARAAEKEEKQNKKAQRQQNKRGNKVSAYREYLDRVRRDKQKRFKWQKKLQQRNLSWREDREDRLKRQEEEKRKKEEEKGGQREQEKITSRDTDPTATQKGLSNVLSAASQLGKVGVKAFLKRNRTKNKSNIQQVQVRDVTEPSDTSKSREVLALPPSRTTTGSTPLALPPSGSTTASNPQMLGNKKRESINKGTYLGRGQVSEQYSCWREEFIHELASLRTKVKNRKKDKPVDIMSGKNSKNIKLNPSVAEKFDYYSLDETTNGASIFAKATPPMKKRTTPMSDIHLSKQPGKRTPEAVTDEMRKLFLGDRRNHYPNYDLSGHVSDGSDVDSNKSINSEAYNIKNIARFSRTLKG